ncbi:hypothetical protein GHT06_001684 [Daphnia sinensis]|uniref:Uncharacterized protein n=1 Tax=Daphnia sinensis TaxID=1820382 RepID=A0AAD5PLY6_9CRUS|nr:hypothetical protein GHT06_001684 [Daphnia sinensis]
MHRSLARATTRYNFSAHHLPTLPLGAHVLIQYHSTKRCDTARRCCRSWRQQGLHRENSLGTLVPPKSPPTQATRAAIVPPPALVHPPPALEPDIAPRQSRQRQPRTYGPATRRSARAHSAPLRYPA